MRAFLSVPPRCSGRSPQSKVPSVVFTSRHPDRSEAEWRDLFFADSERMNRSLHCAARRSAPVGMTGLLLRSRQAPHDLALHTDVTRGDVLQVRPQMAVRF